VWLYLAAKPSNVVVDVDGLACSLQPSDEGIGSPARHHLVLSLQWVVAPLWGCEAP
jgi:hypothetical protein